MKKLCVLFCLIAAVLSMVSASAFAAETEKNVIDLGDGYYMVETIVQYPMSRSGNVVSGAKNGNVYYGSRLIGTAALVAAFDISGSSANATEARISGSGRNGGECTKENAYCDRNTAYGTAIFEYNGGEKRINLELSCSPNGSLS